MNALVMVVAPLAPLHEEPRVSSPQVSQALGGHVLSVLEMRDEWRQVRGEDRYEGWVHAGYLAPILQPPPEDERHISLGCIVHGSGGRPPSCIDVSHPIPRRRPRRRGFCSRGRRTSGVA
jgi:hypothetical protein